MKTKSMLRNIFIGTMFSCLMAGAVFAQSPAFTYQGKLTDNGAPANGSYEMRFRLFDQAQNGFEFGTPKIIPAVAATNGVFTVKIDLGDWTFDQNDRYVEVAVRPQGSAGPFTILAPLQQITLAPKAMFSDTAGLAATSTYAEDSLKLNGLAASSYLQTNGNGSGLTNLNGANITSNTINASALSSDTFANRHNLSLLGSLRWDLLAQRVSVGDGPRGVAFDGENIWVANGGSNNVTKLRASDGMSLGNFPVGTRPSGIAFDGANVWVANAGSDNVTKLRASDGVSLGTFTVGDNPYGVAFDGANIWVTNWNSNNVTKLLASDGSLQATFAVGFNPLGIAFDGENIWVVRSGTNNVLKFRASDGSAIGTYAVGNYPQAVAFDGAIIWVTNYNSVNVTKLRAFDGAFLGTLAVSSNPDGVAFDGTNVWVVIGSGSVLKLRTSDSAYLGYFVVGSNPAGVAFDGANVWVTNEGSDNVTKVPAFQ